MKRQRGAARDQRRPRAVVEGDEAERALAAMRARPLGKQAAIIGTVAADPPGTVFAQAAFGGTRIVDLLVGDRPAAANLLRRPDRRRRTSDHPECRGRGGVAGSRRADKIAVAFRCDG